MTDTVSVKFINPCKSNTGFGLDNSVNFSGSLQESITLLPDLYYYKYKLTNISKPMAVCKDLMEVLNFRQVFFSLSCQTLHIDGFKYHSI
jgi:hypothetical protein